MEDNPGPRVVVYGDGEPEPAAVLLNEFEVRVLGALVEKQVATPDYYPLTLNALVNACNQTSSRDPVVSYDETTVLRALDGLRDQKLATVSTGAESRVAKYRHRLTERFELTPAEVAVLCLLLLRGPQTVGEIRSRSGRLHDFVSLDEVSETLTALAARSPQSLVVKLPRQPGAKEARQAHLLAGEISLPAAAVAAAPLEATPNVVREETDRIAKLEQAVASLREAVQALQDQLAVFRKQFE